jgi:dTDP-glucose pyrophosphorylase
MEDNGQLREAILLLDRYSHQVVYVMDSGQRVVGVVTDGDIRRAMIRGQSPDTPIEEVMARNFISIAQGATDFEILDLMNKHNLRQLPVLDAEGRLVRACNMATLGKEDLVMSVNNEAFVIMAGGLGSRLYPLTKEIPKPLIEVNDTPLIEIIINSAIKQGFRNFIVCVNYLAEKIISYLGDGKEKGIEISYVTEPYKAGTAGALFLCRDKLTPNFIVCNADIVTSCNFNELLKFHQDKSSLCTMAVVWNETQLDFGVVESDQSRLISIKEKPKMIYQINAGIYAINTQFLDKYPKREFVDMTDILHYWITSINGNTAEGVLSTFPLYEFWADVGTHEALASIRGRA